IDPSAWNLVNAFASLQTTYSAYLCAAFDPWTGYILLSSTAGSSNGISLWDPGTGHVPGSLEKYPIPDLREHQVYSLAVDPGTADLYFVGTEQSFSGATFLYRVRRSTGQVSQITSVPYVSIAFGEHPFL